jgi:hypothetical protein
LTTLPTEEERIAKEFYSVCSDTFYELSRTESFSCADKQLFYKAAKAREGNWQFSDKQMRLVLSKLKNNEQRQQNKNRSENKDIAQIKTNKVANLTVRVAWHDRGWDGHICSDPSENYYCVGERSLLSRRLQENRDLETEFEYAGCSLTKFNDYIPPCFWGINAFGTKNIKVRHINPACPQLNPIEDSLKAFSLFTWPFHLSFAKEKDGDPSSWGKYPPEEILKLRVKKFLTPLQKEKTIVFVYANYDNPISADSDSYLLVACGLLGGYSSPKQWTPAHIIEATRKSLGMNNFPEMNWAIPIHLHPQHLVRLPYQESLKWLDEIDDESLLNTVGVILDDPMIQHSFKYVAMGIDNDLAIYLLNRMIKSLSGSTVNDILTRYGYNAEEACTQIKELLEVAWKNRGSLPGLPELISALMEDQGSAKLSSFWQECDKHDDGWNMFCQALDGPSKEEKALSWELKQLRQNMQEYDMDNSCLRILASIDLTLDQYKKLLESGAPSAYANNPYLLYEESASKLYKDGWFGPVYHQTTKEYLNGPIPLFKIDFAMFPDVAYVTKAFDDHKNKA